MTEREPTDVVAASSRVADALAGVDSAAVAFSGGVDSSVMTALAVRLLGANQVVAVLGVSPSLAAAEREGAATTAAHIGVRLVEVVTHEMNRPEYVANAGNRCYFCKHELYTRSFVEVVQREGVQVMLNGDTADDAMRTDRPGARAATELGVRSPLVAAGVDKAMVRRLALHLGLPTWDKPSAPCLASRIPVNRPVTIGSLARVERAEASLRHLGLRELRVRDLGATARVELTEQGHQAMTDPAFRDQVRDALQRSGYGDLELSPAVLRRD